LEKLSKSPLMQYIDAYDLKNIDMGYNEYWVAADRQDCSVLNQMLANELEYRQGHFRNIVFSVEGTQGDGKSAGMLSLGASISQFFNTKFSVDHIHFYHEDLMKDLKNFKKRTFYCQDEQPRAYGLMSSFIQDELANYEDTYRKPQVNIGYASPSLRTHEHFFIFEALDRIFLNEKGDLSAVELMLKTKRRSDGMVLARGKIHLKWPKKSFWDAYNKKKDKFILKMGGKKGDRLKILEDYADKVLKKHKNDLYSHTLQGNIKLKSKDIINLYINKVVGMGNLTGGGLDQTRAFITEKLVKEL